MWSRERRVRPLEVKRISFWVRERRRRAVVEAQVGRVVRGVGGSQPVLGGVSFCSKGEKRITVRSWTN